MADDLLLAIDGGQTSTEALLVRANGTVLARGGGGPMDHVFAGDGHRARAAIHESITRAYDAAGYPPAAAVVVAGMTGVGRGEPESTTLAGMIGEVVRANVISVVPDYVANLAGASAGRAGIAVIAGGGAVAYGTTEDGREAVAGGYGYLLGDEGGGVDIGRRALAAAIRAHDGRNGPTKLERLVLDAYGLDRLEDIKRFVYVPGFNRDRLASLVPVVASAARDGDSVASEIMRSAGRELALIGLAVAGMLHRPGEPIEVYPTGGVFRAGGALFGSFAETIGAGWPTARVCAPHYAPILGALLLAAQLHGIGDPAAWLAGAVGTGGV